LVFVYEGVLIKKSRIYFRYFKKKLGYRSKVGGAWRNP